MSYSGAFSLQHSSRGASISRILGAALAAPDPAAAVGRFALRSGERLLIDRREYLLSDFRRVFVLAIGKAAPAMASALIPLVSDKLAGGLIVAKTLPAGFRSELPVILAGHPVPDENSLRAGRETLALLARLAPQDLLVCLLSGGGSALLAAPRPGLDLVDLQDLTGALLSCGAEIAEINLLRRKLDLLKGGGVARLAAPTQVVSLILSDVIGDSLEAIASGPTAPDESTSENALQVLARYDLLERVPPAVIAALRAQPASLFTRSPVHHPPFTTPHNIVIANNHTACQAAFDQALKEGFSPVLLPDPLRGEAREAGRGLAERFRSLEPGACLIAGGETTVTVTGPGRGGRNQELALAAAIAMDGMRDTMLVSLATDGEDGPTDAAGAVVTGESLARARGLGLDAHDFLRRNDSYHFFAALNDLLLTGPTGTNVDDLTLLLKL